MFLQITLFPASSQRPHCLEGDESAGVERLLSLPHPHPHSHSHARTALESMQMSADLPSAALASTWTPEPDLKHEIAMRSCVACTTLLVLLHHEP